MEINSYLEHIQKSLPLIDPVQIEALAWAISKCRGTNARIFVFGNGGSGANASHFVQDLLKCPVKDFSSSSGRFAAICLNDNTPVVMAYANDLDYSEVFRQQLMNFARPGDLVIAISGSGNSKNVLKAIEYALTEKLDTFGICGFEGGVLLGLVKNAIHFKTSNMQVFEDLCSITLHAVVSNLL